MVVSQFEYWSSVRGANMLRIGTAGSAGGEVFVMIDSDAASGKEWRRRRNMAIEQLERAVRAGHPPGEVKVNYEEEVANG